MLLSPCHAWPIYLTYSQRIELGLQAALELPKDSVQLQAKYRVGKLGLKGQSLTMDLDSLQCYMLSN